jgi:hypothetical protein
VHGDRQLDDGRTVHIVAWFPPSALVWNGLKVEHHNGTVRMHLGPLGLLIVALYRPPQRTIPQRPQPQNSERPLAGGRGGVHGVLAAAARGARKNRAGATARLCGGWCPRIGARGGPPLRGQVPRVGVTSPGDAK